jgi:ABC-type lipoprotein release transport system permease subunit
MVQLSVAALTITLLASLYPAWFAARMEPIEALRAQ